MFSNSNIKYACLSFCQAFYCVVLVTGISIICEDTPPHMIFAPSFTNLQQLDTWISVINLLIRHIDDVKKYLWYHLMGNGKFAVVRMIEHLLQD